ncbi:vWA domain-containing protein [Natronoglomus mannanivorans]|uniref:vWA domain-containing protein n=1 Tax=Natronoglomus mannanivorans TaxID=2979990 RepID=UPI003CCE4CFB
MYRSEQQSGRDNRSLSPVVGLILLVGIVALGSALIFVYGVSMSDEVKEQSNVEHAKLSISQVDQCISTATLSGDRGLTCDVEKYDVVDDGELEVMINDEPDCSASATLGTLSRDVDGTVFGYQAGGRFQQTESGSTVISEPDITYSRQTIDGEETMLLDISLVNVTGTADGTTVRRTGTDRADFGACVGDRPVESMTMYVNGSTFHDAWTGFLESEFGEDNVESTADSIEVSARLGQVRSADGYINVDPIVYGGLYSSKDLTVPNNDNLVVQTTTGQRDWFVTNGDLETQPNTHVDADVVATRSLQRGQGGGGNPPTITGDVYYGGTDNWQGDVETTHIPALQSVDDIPSIDSDVEAAHDRLEGSESIDGSTVTAGAYVGTHSSLDDVETIDTSDGDVHIGVTTDGWARLEDLTIVGDGRVTLSLDGGDLEFTGTTGGDDADQLWVYGTQGTGVTIADEFTGVVYKPGAGGSDVKLDDGVSVTGTVVGPLVLSGNGGSGSPSDYSITFDESLRTHALLDTSNGDVEVNIVGDEIDPSEFDAATLSVVDQQVAQDHVVENTSTIRKPLDVTFVLDRSGSMDDSCYLPVFDECLIGSSGNDPDGLRVDAAKNFIGQMNESIGDRAGVVEFDHAAEELHPLDGNFAAVNESVEANADGATNISAGIDLALDEQEYRDEENAERVIVLLSDGENDAGGSPPKETLDDMTLDQAERAAENNITIHTIGLGDEIDEDLLPVVADLTGGQYHHVDNADGLEEIFENVSQDVTDGRERVIENKDVETTVGDTEITEDEQELDPSETISLRVDAYGCDGYDPTGSTVTDDDGTDFEYVDCEERDEDSVTEVDKTTSVHDYGVYTDGDTVPQAHYLGDDKGWWQDDFEDTLRDRGLASGGIFDLESGQAIIVVQFEGGDCAPGETCEEPFGYAVYLFEGSADDELTVNPPDDHGPANTASNTYVINIVETEIGVGDD